MSIQLTKELLYTFVANATRKAEQTLHATHTIPASVFGNTALFYLIPSNVDHPLRRFISLKSPFILVSAFRDSQNTNDAQVRYTQTVSCGAQPLATWHGMADQKDVEPVSIAQPFVWESQKLEPLERNRARMLTAQYAQILPTLGRDGEDVLPMVVFTSEYDGCVVQMPFYLAVLGAGNDGGFANVVAIKYSGQKEGSVVLVDGADEQTSLRQSHWVEYDLLGSPVHAEAASESLGAALALLKTSGKTQDAIKLDDDDNDNDNDEPETRSISDVDSVVSAVDLAFSSSFVTLHGVWEAEKTDTKFSVSLPLLPPASSQWMLELVSTPLTKDPEAHKHLRKLYMEIKRLETWCECWMAGSKWMDNEQANEQRGGMLDQQSATMFKCHEWQKTEETMRFVDQDSQEENTGTVEDLANTSALEKHRSRLGKIIDRFIDTSIQVLVQTNDEDSGSTNFISGTSGKNRAGSPDMLEFPVRQDLDFVEQLWALAHHSYDDSDLSEMLAAVAEGLETRRLQPLIHANNQSPLAQVIRDALTMAQQQNTVVDDAAEKDRLAQQLDLWIDEQPLDAFVLAGIQKIRADFWYLFVTQRLATPRQIDVFLDLELEPRCLVVRFWCLLRVLEVWWLVKQAVPGLPRVHVNQVVKAALDRFAGKLAEDDENELVDELYANDMKVAVYLPMYSSEVQDFVASIAEGFDPTRYAAMVRAEGHLDKISRMVHLTKTPVLVDQHFSADSDEPNLLDSSSQSEDTYTVFQASLF
ncbi:hypothetical protein H4R99_002988 [Coemansia sp. RSA 1722]|nr:hypothetical protein IWW45_007921 [Coemansia sp. RSA 485]KAJ2601519.1 hypothetical protein H4R99_002988 [Coemansia sp. RSA 1722]